MPRLDVQSESVDVNVRGSGFETPVAAFVEIDVVEENDDLGRGDKRALKVNARGGRGFGVRNQVAHVLASQKLQIGRGEIERIEITDVISSVAPRGEVVDSGSPGDIFCCHFGTDVGIFGYTERTDPSGKTGRGDKWTCEVDLSESVKPRFCIRADGIGVKLANLNGRHCVLPEM